MPPHRRAIFFVMFVVALGAVAPLWGTIRQVPLSPEETLSYHALGPSSDISYSPDGTQIAYSVREIASQGSWTRGEYARTGVPRTGPGSSIWVINVRSGKSARVSPEGVNAWDPAWDPNRQQIAYISDRDADHMARLWIRDLAAGREHRVSDLVLAGAHAPRWSRDGRAVLVEALPPVKNGLPGSIDQPVATPDAASSVLVYVAAPAQTGDAASGPWRKESGEAQLVLLSADEGTPRWIAPHPAMDAQLSPDGKFVVFTSATSFVREGSQQLLFDISIGALSTGITKTVAKNVRLAPGEGLNWSPDSSQVAYLEDGPDGIGDAFVVNAHTGSVRQVTSFSSRLEPGRRSSGPLWDPTSRWIYFLRSSSLWRARADIGGAELVRAVSSSRLDLIRVGQNEIWSPDGGRSVFATSQESETGTCRVLRIEAFPEANSNATVGGDALLSRCGLGSEMTVSPDQQSVIYPSQDAVHPEEIWWSDTTFQHPRQLTNLNPQLESHDLGSASLVSWQSLDGELLHGILLLPAGYQPGKKYPLVVWVYGGSLLSRQFHVFGGIGEFAGEGFLHLFTTRGCAVLLPDAPMEPSEPMLDLLKTVMPGVEHVIQLGVADPERLGIMGHSFGGYSVLSLLVHTKRFRSAAVSGAFADRLLNYGTMKPDGSAYGIPIEESSASQGVGGTPWQVRQRYVESSPVYYLNRITTPVLILHGAEDSAVQASAADEIFVCLRRLGKTATYVKYEGEDHSPVTWSRAHQLDYEERVLAWFTRYLSLSE